MEEPRLQWKVRATCPHGYPCTIIFEPGQIYVPRVCAHMEADEVNEIKKQKRQEKKQLRQFRRQLRRL